MLKNQCWHSTVYEATEEDTNKAVAAAKAAFPAWAALDPVERGAYLKKLSELTLAATGDLAALDSASMGRPVSTYFDAAHAASSFAHYAEAAWPKGETSLNTKGFLNMTLRQPIGVVGAIIPWNVPIVLLAHKLGEIFLWWALLFSHWHKPGPALAAGCTVVVKSSEKAPLSV